jgi:hypothetical protein
VDHHGEIHIVEAAQLDQLLLAAGELELARADLRLTPLDVAALLGRDREEGHPAGEMIEGLGVDETHGRPQHPGDLRIVAARMGGARRGIGLWMARDAETVQLAEQREGRAFARAPASIRPHAGHGEPGARLEAEVLEGLVNQGRCLDFLEAHLRILEDALADADDLVGSPVDRLEDAPLQLVLRHRSVAPLSPVVF